LHLRQVIHNLVKNALEAVEGRPDPHVLVATCRVAEAEEPQVDLRVEDNGGGIDAGLLGTLFDPYVTTKTKGTGLGLAIVKKIIEEHGGIIWAENVDSGARLVARLPVWQGEADGRTLGRSIPPGSPEALGTREQQGNQA
jgi:nitrogen fixation/metabolism regulation signal transduction histidine kinase